MRSILHGDPKMNEEVQGGPGCEGRHSEAEGATATAARPQELSPYLALSPGGFPQLLPGSPKTLSEGGQSRSESRTVQSDECDPKGLRLPLGPGTRLGWGQETVS